MRGDQAGRPENFRRGWGLGLVEGIVSGPSAPGPLPKKHGAQGAPYSCTGWKPVLPIWFLQRLFGDFLGFDLFLGEAEAALPLAVSL